MNNIENNAEEAPATIDAFIERFAPRFAQHPGELVMVVKRDDDDGFRGGPGMHSPLPDSRGLVMRSDYELAVIDPGKRLERRERTVIVLPTERAVIVNCHGTNAVDFVEMVVDAFYLADMSDCLIALHLDEGEKRLPKFEILVGDEAVKAGLANVINERELLAINAAATKLGHPLGGSKKLDAVVGRSVDGLVASLIRTVFGEKPKVINRKAVEECIKGLGVCGVERDRIPLLCLQKLIVELTDGLQLPRPPQ